MFLFLAKEFLENIKIFWKSYEELSKKNSYVLGDSDLESLSFVDLRFIVFLLTSYSSFGRCEEVPNFEIADVL